MIDMVFVDKMASVLAYTMTTSRPGGLASPWKGIEGTPAEMQLMCRRIALQLYVDLDAHVLLDLALAKYEADRQLPAQEAA
jgi:hypothetical protein